MLSRMSKREKIILGVLLAVLVMVGFGCFILTPQINAYALVKEELSHEQAKLLKAQATASSFKEETDKLAMVQEEIKATGSRFAIEMNDGSDVIYLGIRSTSQKVLIKLIEPGIMKENPHSYEFPLKIEVEGNFRNLMTFCRDLDNHIENLINLAEIRNIKIETADSDFSPGGVKAIISMVIYSAKNPDQRLNLEQVSGWLTGRHNVFSTSVFAAPIPELTGQIHAQASPDGGASTGGSGKPAAPQGGTTKPASQTAGTKDPVNIDRTIVDPEYVQR